MNGFFFLSFFFFPISLLFSMIDEKALKAKQFLGFDFELKEEQDDAIPCVYGKRGRSVSSSHWIWKKALYSS